MAGADQKSVGFGSTLLLAIATLLLNPSCRFDKKEPLANRSSEAGVTALADESPLGQSAERDAIVITFGDRYEPFAWGEGPAVQGVQVDFVREILAERMGLKVILEGCPWKRCQKWVREGRTDGFVTVPTHEREEYTVKSSIPFYETDFVMHIKKRNPLARELLQVRSLKDLEPMQHVRHIHMLGSGWHENALKNMKSVITVPNASVIPKMLVLDRADVYIEQDEMFRYQAQSAGVSDELMTIKEPSIMRVGFHLFIGKNSKQRSVMTEINKVLTSLKASGELEKMKQRILAKYGI